MKNIIEVRGLTKVINGKIILDQVDLTVKEGTIYGFLGPNGAGKTTLMKILLTLTEYESGKVIILGKELEGNREEILSEVGSIIEIPIFYENCTAKEILELHADYMKTSSCKSSIPEVLALVGLENIESKKIKNFSLGMKQRLALARALITKPKLLILDEPINGLDPMGVKQIRDILLNLVKKKGMTVLMSSHILSEIEQLSDKIGVIKKGRMLEEVEMDKLKKNNVNLESYFMAHFEETKLSNYDY
jgi:ABC-2 type transport system ATP-binding protein